MAKGSVLSVSALGGCKLLPCLHCKRKWKSIVKAIVLVAVCVSIIFDM